MIKLEHITYSYSKNNPSANVIDTSLTINDGECVLLCGRSGCGKTTIARIINKLIPDFYDNGCMSGNVFIDGVDTSEIVMYELSKLIGTVFQNPKAQFFHTNSDAEIVFGLENRGLKTDEIIHRYQEVVKEFNIERLTNKSMFNLSAGEKQIIAFASIYAMNPRIYILDEPTANIDKSTILKVRNIIKKLKQTGHTVVICEHRLYFLKDLVDQVIYVDQGEIKQTFNGTDFFKLPIDSRIAMGLRDLDTPILKTIQNKSEENLPLAIENLSCGFDKHILFDHINLKLNAGEILGITGNNGVGKTTLVRTIAGLHKEFDGQITLNHKIMNAKQRQDLTAMVMQDVNYQLFTDSVIEECRLGNVCSEEQIDKILKELHLSEFKEAHPVTLSGGQKQRLVLANAILSDKKVFIFDEPTSGLDYEGMIAVSTVLKNLSKKSYYIIVVSHDIEFINSTCDRIYNLENGGESYE